MIVIDDMEDSFVLLIEYLVEFWMCLICLVIVFVVGFIICFIFGKYLLDFLLILIE